MALTFEQQPNESAKAFSAFSLYLSLGPERSLEAVGRKLGKSTALLERWSARWRWAQRLAAHAAHLAAAEREATEALARGNAAQWLTRQQSLREEEWRLHEECIAAGREALKRFYERGKGATLGDVARLLELASKLGRLASGLATDKTEVTGEDGGPIRLEFEAALRKVYGQAEGAGAVVDVEAAPLPAQLEIGQEPRSPGRAA
jgi:hypothetical protein